MRPIHELAADICTLAGRINAANHRWLVLIAEFDRREGWADSSTQSCAHWLNWKCGIAMGAARHRAARREVRARVSPLPGGGGVVGAPVDSVAPGFTQPRGDWSEIPQGVLVARWRGERMDYGLAIDGLIHRARQAKDVPAGTSPPPRASSR